MDAAATLREIARATLRERTLIAAWNGASAMKQEADKIAALLDSIRALEKAKVPYALIGGLAVGVHSGLPRATLDVDLAVPSTTLPADLSAALKGAGFRLVGTHAHSINFRHPTGEPLQLAFDPAFDTMIERAETVSVAGVAIRIVRRDDLIAMKERAAGDPARRRSKRLRDQADIELLKGDVPDPDEGW